jgi:ParB-like chromosome segregation protein Spo0J
MSQLQIRYVSPGILRPHPRNARNHSERQIAKIAASIRSFGFNIPVNVDDDGQLLAGHGRVLAALKLGLKEVPSVALWHLSETQRRVFTLADNRLGVLSE